MKKFYLSILFLGLSSSAFANPTLKAVMQNMGGSLGTVAARIAVSTPDLTEADLATLADQTAQLEKFIASATVLVPDKVSAIPDTDASRAQEKRSLNAQYNSLIFQLYSLSFKLENVFVTSTPANAKAQAQLVINDILAVKKAGHNLF